MRKKNAFPQGTGHDQLTNVGRQLFRQLLTLEFRFGCSKIGYVLIYVSLIIDGTWMLPPGLQIPTGPWGPRSGGLPSVILPRGWNPGRCPQVARGRILKTQVQSLDSAIELIGGVRGY